MPQIIRKPFEFGPEMPNARSTRPPFRRKQESQVIYRRHPRMTAT